MALSEQPLKKRRLLEGFLPETPPSTQPPPPLHKPPQESCHESGPSSPPASSPLSQEEILRRRRNQEEIRNAWQNYSIIKRCASGKDVQFMPELERAYLSLITASRGCKSVRRIVSEFIPQYASYCPTALEAAAQVVVNMHNQSLPVVSRSEDMNEVAFETARNCTLGLIDICCTASSVASTSSVIRGICTAVFLNVLTFFGASFEGKNVIEIIDNENIKMLDSVEFLKNLKQKYSAEDGSAELRLLKLQALSFLRIFFCCPKNVLGACFDLFNTSVPKEVCKQGRDILTLLSSTLNCDDALPPINKSDDQVTAGITDMEADTNEDDINCKKQASDGCYVSGDVPAISKNCLLGLVLQRNPSLKSWIFSRYKKLCNSASPQVVSDATAIFQGIFDDFTELVKEHNSREDSDDDSSDPSRYVDRQYLVAKISNRQMSSPVCGKTSALKGQDESCVDDAMSKSFGQYLQRHSSRISQESDHHSNTSSNLESGGLKSKELESKERGDICGRSPIPRDHHNDRLFSPLPRKPLDIKTNFSEIGNYPVQGEQYKSSNLDALISSCQRSSNTASINQMAAPYPCTSNQIRWFSDGDPTAMEVFAASKQLWLGSLPPDVSEASVRFELEKFGLLDNFSYFPFKGFALVEYRSIMDAVKARECMRWRSPWDSHLRIKFMDIGLGTRGAVDGTAIGSSCYVYVGNVSSQWVKDEILLETKKVVFKGPHWVTDLVNEAALLLEFETPEEAASAMVCLRQHRKGRTNYTSAFSHGPTDIPRSHVCYASSMSAPSCTSLGNASASELRSPPAQTALVSHLGNHNVPPPMVKPDSGPAEFVSPRSHYEKQGLNMQTAHVSQLNWSIPGSTAPPEVGMSKYDGYGNSVPVSVTQGGNSEQIWTYRKLEHESLPAPIMTSCMPVVSQGPLLGPQHHNQASAYTQPAYPLPSCSWDARGLNSHQAVNIMPPGFMSNSLHGTAIPPPFIPASVTPLSQVQGAGIQQHGQIVPQPVLPPPLSSMPLPKSEIPSLPLLKSEVLPPLPPSPPAVPPPPNSPPPPPLDAEPAITEYPGCNLPIKWQGSLSKSGVHYCMINAYRMDSDNCKYSNSISEPADWPSKLDMTKRTDFQHVKSTFANTPPHRREVCLLLPSSPDDHKRFQDFILYLKQRECAGVIKILAVKPMWARLLFILPYSPETCSMLSVVPSSSDCLVALILPKESNSELA